jgi:hypothetical protein
MNGAEISPYFQVSIIGSLEALDLSNRYCIRVFFSSRNVGGFKGREGMAPVCHSCEKRLGVKRSAATREEIPPEVLPIVFSAQRASEELGISLELIDVNRLSTFEKMKEKMNGKPLPRVSVGEDFLTGSLSKAEIVEFYKHAYRTQVQT